MATKMVNADGPPLAESSRTMPDLESFYPITSLRSLRASEKGIKPKAVPSLRGRLWSTVPASLPGPPPPSPRQALTQRSTPNFSTSYSPRVSPRDRRFALALQEVQTKSDVDIAHPALHLPRRRLATEGSKEKKRTPFVTPPPQPVLRSRLNRTTDAITVYKNEVGDGDEAASSPLIFGQPGQFRVETGASSEAHVDMRWTRGLEAEVQSERFLEHAHAVYFLRHKELGPVVLALEQAPGASPSLLACSCPDARVLVASSRALLVQSLSVATLGAPDWPRVALRLLLPKSEPERTLHRRQSDTALLSLPPMHRLSPAQGQRLVAAAVARHYAARVKIGLLRQGPGQCFEDQLYAASPGSEAFMRFLATISDEGSVTNGRFLAHWGRTALLYHCAPFMNGAENTIRHDHVILVFQEGEDDVFVPTAKVNHFTQVYVVVSPRPGGYRVHVASRLAVPPFPPSVSADVLSRHDLRHFLLPKLVYGARAAASVSREYTQATEEALEAVVAQSKTEAS